MKTLSRPTGTQDWVKDRAQQLSHVERTLSAVFESYSFEPIRLPMMETVDLFKRGVGDATDIVEKEMFLLQGRGAETGSQDVLALRPEGTASTVRALQQEGLLYNQQQRVYYSGSMFRYERPQKGRYREFYQLGAEAFGFAGPDLDVELLLLARDCWQALGIEHYLTLELNSIGSADDRIAFGAALKAFLLPHASELDSDSQRRLERNPLRILDSKSAQTQHILTDAPRLEDFINPVAQAHFESLCEWLDDFGLAYRRNPRLVRGLDYYNNTVLEWMTDRLGAQGTVCAGGRYDGLVERLGGKPTPAAGFAMGLDRIVLLSELRQAEQQGLAAPANPVDVYLCIAQADSARAAERVAQRLRMALPALKLRVHRGGGKLDKQLKRADQSGAEVALIVGPEEVAAGTVVVKPLRGTGEAGAVAEDQLADRLQALLTVVPSTRL